MLSGAEQGSKPRNNALHCVCCMETIYVSLTRHNKQVFLNPTPHPRAVVHSQEVNLCTPVNRFAARQIWAFCKLNLRKAMQNANAFLAKNGVLA